MNRATASRRTGLTYLNGVLTAIAGLLALHLAASDAPDRPLLISSASAEPPDEFGDGADPSGSRVSAAEQRKVMIAELRAMSKRLSTIETALGKGISVKVTSMPDLKLPNDRQK